MATYLITVGESITLDEDDPEKALESAITSLQQKLRAGGEVKFMASVVESPSYGVTRPVFNGREVTVTLPTMVSIPVTIHSKPRATRKKTRKK